MTDELSGGEVAAALAALDVARGRFIAVVGHELRTPVTTLRGLAEELVAAGANPPAELAPAILRSAQRIEALLDDLLLAADITTALPVGPLEDVDLVATAQAIWDSLEVDDELALTGDAEVHVLLREGAADTLLERVLDNARLYGEPPFLLHAVTKDGRAQLIVSNGGRELQPDDVHLAFELFYRSEAAVTSAPGFGIGLPVARALARQHDGDVTLEPRPGGGLDVQIDLPAAP